MSLEEAARNATDFSKSFAQSLAQLISEFPQQYWGFFPKYMTSPFRIRAILASNAIAIRYVRPSRKLRVLASPRSGRLEGTIFPYVGTTSMFRLTHTHDSAISHMTLANKDFADNHPMTSGTNLVCPSDFGVAEIGEDVEFIFEDVNFAWRIGKRDVVLYEYLLWILSPPASNTLGSQSGAEKAVSRFGDFLFWAIFDADNPKSFELNYARFLLTAARMLESQFENLLARSDIEEEELQEFLCNHKAILTNSLGFGLAQCKYRPNAQDVVDFLLTSGNPSSKCLAIEIEPSHYEVVTAADVESARLRGALAQVKRYMKAVSQHADFAKSQIGGLTIIGRSSTMDECRRKALEALNHSLSQDSIRVITFDELLAGLRSRREGLEARVIDLSAKSEQPVM